MSNETTPGPSTAKDYLIQTLNGCIAQCTAWHKADDAARDALYRQNKQSLKSTAEWDALRDAFRSLQTDFGAIAPPPDPWSAGTSDEFKLTVKAGKYAENCNNVYHLSRSGRGSVSGM